METTFHCTDLDSWIWFNKLDDMPKEELIGRLLRTEPPNEQMLMGTAWHSVLENPPETINSIKRGGFEFIVECDAEIVLPQIREIRSEKTYFIDGVKVTLTGKVDGITGNMVDDHKLTFNPNPENYLNAYQWKAYLDIYNADIFEYIIYHGFADEKTITIRDVSTMRLYRYPKMKKDLEFGISELLGFVKSYVPQMIK